MKNKIPISVSMRIKHFEILKGLAADRDLNFSEYITLIFDDYLERLEAACQARFVAESEILYGRRINK
jgi:hypothetical protein